MTTTTTPPAPGVRQIRQDLGEWRLRDLGLTKAEAAEAAGCSASAVSRMIAGDHRGDPELLERFVATVLRMPLDLVAPYTYDAGVEDAGS